MRVNLFIDKEIIKNRAELIKVCKQHFYKGGDWHEFFEVDGIKYCLTKAEINLNDETPDFSLDFAKGEGESYDCIEINTGANWLQQLISEQGITVYEFAKRCEISKDSIYKIINRNSSIEGIGLSTAEALAKGLGITTVEFITTVYNRFKTK